MSSALPSPVWSIQIIAFLSYSTSPIIIEIYIIEEVVSLIFGHITTIATSDNGYGD